MSWSSVVHHLLAKITIVIVRLGLLHTHLQEHLLLSQVLLLRLRLASAGLILLLMLGHLLLLLHVILLNFLH